MIDTATPPEWVLRIEEAEERNRPALPPHWYLGSIGFDFDADEQLTAIRVLIARHRAAETALTAEYERAARLVGDHVGDVLDGIAHHSIFQDAAHSMAAVGMLAPFLETVFHQCFLGVGARWPGRAAPNLVFARWGMSPADRWNCHLIPAGAKARPDLVRGVVQLAEATGLARRLPPDYQTTLAALFGYRNKMFHCGLEWPTAERAAFKERIEKEGWPAAWFPAATIDGVPWVFYMSDGFIDHCLELAETTLRAFGELVRDDMRLG